MADIKISQLGEALAVTDNDILPMTASGVTSKVKAITMKDYMIGSTNISGLGDGTPTGAIDALDDEIDANYAEWKDQWKKNGAYNIAPNDITSQVLNGVTVAKNADESVTLNNTAVSPGFTLYAFNKIQIPDGTYKLVGCPSGASDNFRMTLLCNSNNTSKGNDTGSGLVFTYNASTDINLSLYLWVKTGYTCDNVVFKPMITTDLNATYADYVPHAKTNRELTENIKITTYTRTTDNTGECSIGSDSAYVPIGGSIVGTQNTHTGAISFRTASSDRNTYYAMFYSATSSALNVVANKELTFIVVWVKKA